MFWVERYGYIQHDKGLVYGKSKHDMTKSKTILLKGKKLMKGKRRDGSEYLAICIPGTGENIEIKIS